MNAKERADVSINYSNAKNSVRTTLIQAIAGAAFFATAFFAWRQVTVARAAQSTDRFTKSIERLGDESSAVRLGSVYTLEELGNDATYARQVAHVLVAFIREVSDESSATNVAAGVGTIGSSSASPVPNVSLAPYDVREAASIIAARGLWRRAVGTQLDLSFTLLRGVDLSGADLTGIDLRSTDLAYADLRKAVLADADLRGAKLISANLDGATLHHAKLTGADLEHASLRGAVGRRVHFEYCVMTKVDLSSSTLVNCDFSNANLTEAAADGATLTGSVFYDATLVLANFQNADLTDSNLLGADLRGVTWTDAVRERMKGVSPAPNEGS